MVRGAPSERSAAVRRARGALGVGSGVGTFSVSDRSTEDNGADAPAMGTTLRSGVFWLISTDGETGRTMVDLFRARLPLRTSLSERAAAVDRVSCRVRAATLTLFALDSVAICEERYAVRPDSSGRRGAVTGEPDAALRD